MRPVVLDEAVDAEAVVGAPGVYAAVDTSPAFGVLQGLAVADEARDLGGMQLEDGHHMIAIEVGARRNAAGAISIGAEFFAGAKKDYENWEEKWWREAIQNAVDATASEVHCKIEMLDENEQPLDDDAIGRGMTLKFVRVSCGDDGVGMTEDTLLNKFLVLGRSGKGSDPGSVGGFGKAKELLLLPWVRWSVATKRIGEDVGVIVEGHGIQYDVKPFSMPGRHGTLLTVVMSADEATTASRAISFIEKCYLPKVLFYVNDKPYKAKLKVGELVRTIGEAGTVDAEVYYDKRSKLNSAMLVRVAGMYMHEKWISSDIKGTIIVELKGRSTDMLTANRDGIGKRDLRYALDDFQNQLAADTKTALRKKQGILRERFSGAGKFSSVSPKEKQRDILFAMGSTSPVDGELTNEQKQAVLGQMQEPSEAGPIDLRPSRAAIAAMMEAKLLGSVQVKALAWHAAWNPDFFIYNEIQGWRVPAKFRPEKMSSGIRKLARFWAELCRFVLIQLNHEGEYGVGWMFDNYTAAAHQYLDNEHWLLLNPFIKGEMEGRGGSTGTGEMWQLSNPEHINSLYALAVHEATHMANGISYHDESFATAFTWNVARTANRGKQIEKIRRSVVARAAQPGVGITGVGITEPKRPDPHSGISEDAGESLWIYTLPAGDVPGIGPERRSYKDGAVERLDSEHGSTRYLLKKSTDPSEIIGALQVVSRDGKHATIANVYVKPEWRRAGIAQHLLFRARRDFDEVKHADDVHLSPSGRAWRAAVNPCEPCKHNPPLTIPETRRRIAAVGGGRGWDIFERGDGEWSIQIDDEFWADTPQDQRVTDDDVAQLPEAQRALIYRGGEDEARRQAKAAVVAALNITSVLRDDDRFVNAIVDRLNFTVSFRTPAPGERAWEVDDWMSEQGAVDEIWLNSEDFGWMTERAPGRATTGMKYAVISIGDGDLNYVVEKWLTMPEQFANFARLTAGRISDSVVEEPRRTRWQTGGAVYVGSRHTEDAEPDNELIARVAIREAMQFDMTALARELERRPAQQPDVLRLADQMVRSVAYHMAAHGGGPNWDRLAQYRNAPDFKEQVHRAAAWAGLGSVDVAGRPHSLLRPPAFWEYRGEPERGRVPIRYERPVQLEPLELAIATALNLDIPEIAVDPDRYRGFIAAVWEHVLEQPSTPREWRYGAIANLDGFQSQVRISAGVIAYEDAGRYNWAASPTMVVPIRKAATPRARAMGMPPPEEIPPEARGIAQAMGSEWEPSPPDVVPAGRVVPTPSTAMEMEDTGGWRGSYPAAIRTFVQNFRDTSYGNDMYDSVEFSVGNAVYRLWVAGYVPGSREEPDDPRYMIQVVTPPHRGATVEETFEDGQPTGDEVFRTESPDNLLRFIRSDLAGTPLLDELVEMTTPGWARATGGPGGRVEPALPDRYQRVYDRVIEAMNRADEIGGPEGDNYVEMMRAIGSIADDRAANGRLDAHHDEAELAGVPLNSTTWALPVISIMDELDNVAITTSRLQHTDAYRQFMERIAIITQARADAAEAGRTERRRPPAAPYRSPHLDMKDVRGQAEAVAAAENAVAWRQSLLLVGGGVNATAVARRIPTLFPPTGEAPFRSPHHTIDREAILAEAQLAKRGVLYLADLDQFYPGAIEALAVELRKMTRDDRPIVVASVASMPLPRRMAQALDLPLRATVQAVTLEASRTAQAAEESAAIRARIAAGPPAPVDISAERFRQLELGRSGGMGMPPLERSLRLKAQFVPEETRVQLLRTVVHGTWVYPKGLTGTVEKVSADRVEIRPDNIGDPGTQYLVYDKDLLEQLAGDLEVETEAAQRFRMIEMNPKNNPAWVTSLLSRHFELLEDSVPAKWLPKLKKVKAQRGKLTAAMKEYGCGAYGCVLPTLDPKVVLKVTTDDTEFQFANELAGDLAAQVTVTYHLVAGLPEKHKGRNTYLLWRDSADHVGEIDKVVEKDRGEGVLAEQLVDAQHKAAQAVYVALHQGVPAFDLIDDWETAARAMGDGVPELAQLAKDMITNLKKNKVFMGDVHAGNIGKVGKRWLVVDPGNIAVLVDK